MTKDQEAIVALTKRVAELEAEVTRLQTCVDHSLGVIDQQGKRLEELEADCERYAADLERRHGIERELEAKLAEADVRASNKSFLISNLRARLDQANALVADGNARIRAALAVVEKWRWTAQLSGQVENELTEALGARPEAESPEDE